MFGKTKTICCLLVSAILGCGLFLSACDSKPKDTSPLELPVFYVNTENNAEITSKEDYITCSVTVDYEDTQYQFENAPAKIRGRGNSSWYEMPKKSYRLKFDDKTDLFGHGSAKTWTLIANYCDPSLARNYLAYSMASVLDTQKYTTSTQSVQLYLNGKYNGVYLVCEQVQTGKNRVDIDEGIDSTDTGYLLELDVRIEGDWGIDFVFLYDDYFKDRYYQIKSPDPEDVLKAGKDPTAFADYIGTYLDQCYSAVCDKNYKEICRLIDVDSFAESYLINELFKPQDIGDSSFFLYKEKGGKIYSGPIWDYDISTGNCNYPSSFYTQSLSTNTRCLWAKNLNPWYYKLLKCKEFKALVAQKLAKYADALTEKQQQCIAYLYRHEAAFVKNFEAWDILGKENWPNPEALISLKTWREHVAYTDSWLTKSMDYLKSAYPV